jgi:hypothetical protein
MALKWHGPRIIAKTVRAAKAGVNQTMSQAVIHAKRNHPGWQNRTGKAEGSIQIVKKAEERGPVIVGLWGSRNVVYMLWLELKHGSALRNAAAVTYPNLAANIRRHF